MGLIKIKGEGLLKLKEESPEMAAGCLVKA